MLERIYLLGYWIADCVDGASRTFSETLQNLITEKLLGMKTAATSD